MATCALVAASDFNAPHFTAARARGEFACVYAVDGGFAHLQAVGCTPDLVLGDFDSLGYVPEGAAVERHSPIKDESDLELALCRAWEQGFRTVRVYGALGGRLDHTVAALQTLCAFAEQGMDVTAIGMEEAVHMLVGPGSYELPLLERGTVSVFASGGAAQGVTERGLFYSLQDAVLEPRVSRGLSNELQGQPASISVERGTLLIFHPPV